MRGRMSVARDECYRDLRIPFFDASIMSRLTALAEQRITDGAFIRYDDYETPEEFADVLDTIPEIGEFAGRCTVGCRPLFMFLPPRFSMDIHRDVHFLDTRKCCIGVIAFPSADIAPTRFYAREGKETLVLSADWQHGRPKLLNIQQWHNVDNSNTWRANLQLSLDADYGDVIDLIKTNSLFRGHECELKD